MRNALLIFTLLFTAAGSACADDTQPGSLGGLKLKFSPDVRVQLFATGIKKARHMAFDDQGILFVSQHRVGRVVALPDRDGNGRADKTAVILEGRDTPHGLAFVQLDSGYYLYVAEENQVVRLKRRAKPYEYGPPETIVDDIPGGGHSTRTIKIKDGRLYLSVGSSCNVCREDNPLRAAVSRYDLDGKNGEIFASGLRNSVGIEFSPYSGKLWGVNNGRDWLGDDHPREELNIIEEGKHYGWPYCYEDRRPDPEFGHWMDCNKTQIPAHTFTAHMAPLGLAFYRKGSLPKKYDNSLFIAFHGSWNRSVPAGYKVVRLKLDANGAPLTHEDFITGWLRKDNAVEGRPVDLEQAPNGDLYLTDDYLGAVYLIRAR